MEVCGQWRIGPGGRFAMDWPAVWAMQDRLGFEEDAHTYPKLRALEQAALEDDVKRMEEEQRQREQGM